MAHSLKVQSIRMRVSKRTALEPVPRSLSTFNQSCPSGQGMEPLRSTVVLVTNYLNIQRCGRRLVPWVTVDSVKLKSNMIHLMCLGAELTMPPFFR